MFVTWIKNEKGNTILRYKQTNLNCKKKVRIMRKKVRIVKYKFRIVRYKLASTREKSEL